MVVHGIRRIYSEYPRNFWVVIATLFIDHVGGALIFPFIGLFITAKFQVGMTEIGQLFTIVAITGIFGSITGGAITDKFGRKVVIIFGLVTSALSALTLGFAENINVIYFTGGIIGLFGNVGGPAQQAMIADLLPEEKRADGFGILRVAINLAVTIGPAIGGVLATYSYIWLFIIDSVASTVTAIIVFFIIPETKPDALPDKPSKSILETLGGYFKVGRDGLFMTFMFASILMTLAYIQMNTTLSVFLRDIHGIPDQGYGYLLSLNAGMVVLFQFWITRRIKRLPPMIVMVLGTLFYAIGFSMYGFVSIYILFMMAMVIITIGEMLVAPVGQALVANLAPEDMRGRYMAMFGFSWTIPFALGPLAAGLIMDNYTPNWIWYASGIVSMMAVAVYLFLHFRASERLAKMNGKVQPGNDANISRKVENDSRPRN
ncbi:MAG: MFS transporter [Candidatus Bathyarchaeota archaeon]|nr:MFS transporter [Candidatus Bathyarchaeota archaeon]MDH5734057.1 MFS transporter [Candidatus Bathyarchaeota archaeon]